MTRTEFNTQWEDGLISFSDVIEMMDDHGYDHDGFIEDDDYNNAVEEDIGEFLHHQWWYELNLDALPRADEYEWFRRDGILDYIGMDEEDLDSAVFEFADWMEVNGEWEEEEDDEEEPDYAYTQEAAPDPTPAESAARDSEVNDEDVIDLLNVCEADFRAIGLDIDRETEAARRLPDRIVESIGIRVSNGADEVELPF